jgi:hypothetical protein
LIRVQQPILLLADLARAMLSVTKPLSQFG